MLFLYLAGLATSLTYEYFTFSKISKQLDKDDYTVTDNFNVETNSASMLLFSSFIFIPVVNIVLPIILLNKFDFVYGLVIDTLEKNNSIKKEERPSTKEEIMKENDNSRESKHKDKRFKDLSRKEKIAFFEELRRDLGEDNKEAKDQPKVKKRVKK